MASQKKGHWQTVYTQIRRSDVAGIFIKHGNRVLYRRRHMKDFLDTKDMPIMTIWDSILSLQTMSNDQPTNLIYYLKQVNVLTR